MNDCKKLRLHLHDYAMGNTDEQINTEIEKHLAECDECRRILKAEKLYCENLGYISAILSTPKKEKKLADAVKAQIEHEKHHPLTAAPKRRFPVFSYGTAAALVLVAALLFFAHKNGMIQDIAHSTADTNSTSAEDIITYADDQESEKIYFYTAKASKATESAAQTEESEAKPSAPMLMSAPPDTSLRASGGAAAASDGAADSASNATINSATNQSTTVTDTFDNTESEPEYCQDTDTPVLAKDTSKESVALTESVQTTDEHFAAHKLISDYNDVIFSNALHLLYPQVILPAGDSDYYYTNFVSSNSASTEFSLIDGANLYALSIPLGDLTSSLDQKGVKNYTVILPDEPASGDIVYLYFE